MSPDIPLIPDTPVSPEIPLIPDIPVSPEIPDIPLKPVSPEIPDTPLTPDVPVLPDTPLTPDVPVLPDIPDSPELPATVAKIIGRLLAKLVVPLPPESNKLHGTVQYWFDTFVGVPVTDHLWKFDEFVLS